ncbi:electron transfer flavoprotein subunit alpha/FixB family protein, partial [Paraburkholderia sp. Ac-20347]|nr:electron transfer flavoprotein subunit alpha/FixB family protein [Paraburkholderia sp. Ac-20347]
MRTLVLCDGEVGPLSDVTLRVLGAAQQLGQPVDLLVFDVALATTAASATGVERVLVASAGASDALAPETIAAQLLALANDYS